MINLRISVFLDKKWCGTADYSLNLLYDEARRRVKKAFDLYRSTYGRFVTKLSLSNSGKTYSSENFEDCVELLKVLNKIKTEISAEEMTRSPNSKMTFSVNMQPYPSNTYK